MQPDPIDDHARRAILNLNAEFWGKPRIMSFTWAFAAEIQELEGAIWSVINTRLVDGAHLPQLLILGRLVGQPNQGFDLETYRALIKARVRINRSRGQLRDIIEALRLIYSGDITWREVGVATIAIELEAAGSLNVSAADIVLRDAKAAEEAVLLYHTTAAGLRWDSAEDTVPATGGWGSATDSALGGITFYVSR